MYFPQNLSALLNLAFLSLMYNDISPAIFVSFFQFSRNIHRIQICLLCCSELRLKAIYLEKYPGKDICSVSIVLAVYFKLTVPSNVKEESEKVGLKFNIQKTKIMTSGPITSWKRDGETVDTLADFNFLGSKITAYGDCSHEIKSYLLLGRKVMTNLDSILKSKDVTLPTNAHLVKALVFPVVMYECENWTIKKAEHGRIDAFELWC